MEIMTIESNAYRLLVEKIEKITAYVEESRNREETERKRKEEAESPAAKGRKEVDDAQGGVRDAGHQPPVTRNFAASLFRNIKYFTLRKLYLCRKWMQKRLQKTTTTGITLPNFDFLA